MFCSNCGNELQNNDKFCIGCGLQLNPHKEAYYESIKPLNLQYENHISKVEKSENVNVKSFSKPNAAVHTLVNKMIRSSSIWLIIGIFQIIIGMCTIIFGYGLFTILIGIWNITCSGKEKRNAEFLKRNPQRIVPFFESQRTITVVFLFINLFFGAIIGVLATIYDLTIDAYVSNNKEAFY